MQEVLTAAVVSMILLMQAPGVAGADGVKAAPSAATGEKAASDKKDAAAPKLTGKGVAEGVRVRGTVAAVDKDKGTVTLKGPKGRTVTLDVQDKSKLDAVSVGDPVVATYLEALVVRLKKSGSIAPGTSMQETRVGSKPGENPAGAVGREVTVTATITAIDRKAHTFTIKGPEGRTETITARDPKNLEGVKVGDLVELTYTQALAVALDKPAK